ncbi:transcription initiation factor TFIID subunit 13-like [Dysidea avara]|uniref:transcription initiation factor TFIID subunit 13-like n=1 Tax=Dysidea avara TaxID=196820 RepID=UPI00331F6AE1
MEDGGDVRKREAPHQDGGPPKKKRLFIRELKYMMHGFGDDANPHTETAELVEDLAIDFVTEMTLKAMDVGKKGKVQVEDITFLIRKDPKKHARVRDLLMMNEELKKARKAFDDDVDNI